MSPFSVTRDQISSVKCPYAKMRFKFGAFWKAA